MTQEFYKENLGKRSFKVPEFAVLVRF